MNFSSFEELLLMGGHGVYVWWSYGLGLMVLALNLVQGMRARRRVINELRRMVAAQPEVD